MWSYAPAFKQSVVIVIINNVIIMPTILTITLAKFNNSVSTPFVRECLIGQTTCFSGPSRLLFYPTSII